MSKDDTVPGWFAACLIVMFAATAAAIGYQCGQEDVRVEASKRGLAHYEADAEGRVKFVWGAKEARP